jgi:hypothetical protein
LASGLAEPVNDASSSLTRKHSAAYNLLEYPQNEAFRNFLQVHGLNPKFKQSTFDQLSLV